MNEPEKYISIIHEKRTERHANIHRLVVAGVAGKWVRAWDEFAISLCGKYAARPWSQPLFPDVFLFNSVWATVKVPVDVVEYYSDSDLGLDDIKWGK